MAKVIVEKDESLDHALKRFKKQCESDGIMQELRKREYYRGPAQKRREKSEEAQKRLRKYSK